jgi:SPP1 family phage portal protein
MQDESPLKFPKKADTARKDQYAYYDSLFDGNHYSAFQVQSKRDFDARYNHLRYIVANFAKLMSDVMADMLFGEAITVDVKDDKTQDFLDGLQEQNQFQTQLYESALANSRRGDSCFKMRTGKRSETDTELSLIIEEFTPAIYFPQLSVTGARNTPDEDVIAIVFKQNGITYLHKETHRPGLILHEVYTYDERDGKVLATMKPEDFGFPAQEKTGVKRSLIFHVPNVRDGNGFWGTSDYKGLESLFFALNNRITSIDNILDKHGDPILAVPTGILDEDGKVKKEALGMYEVDNENPGFNKPEYIVWDANLDSAFKEIDKLIEMLFMFSEIAPASMGADQKGGMAESGRALKFKLLATIRKRNRKMRYYDQVIKDMLETAQELAKVQGIKVNGVTPEKVERPTLKWGDGVIRDDVEATETAVKRIDAGISSRADAIADLDRVTPEEARNKVQEIDKESSPAVPAIDNNVTGNPNPAVPAGQNPAAPQPPQPPAQGSQGSPNSNRQTAAAGRR